MHTYVQEQSKRSQLLMLHTIFVAIVADFDEMIADFHKSSRNAELLPEF